MRSVVKTIVVITIADLQDGIVDVTPQFGGVGVIVLYHHLMKNLMKVARKAFAPELWPIQWPEKFKVGSVQKYDGKLNPNVWL